MDDPLTDWLGTLLEYYENEEAAEWLNAPHPMLDGAVPLDLVREGRQDELAHLMDLLAAGEAV